jgi:UPF0755 protein
MKNKSISKGKSKIKKYIPLIGGILICCSIIAAVIIFKQVLTTGVSLHDAVSDLANPRVRYIKIPAGMRREEVAERFAEILGWSEAEKNRFMNTHTLFTYNSEGYFYPETYIIPVNAQATDVSREMREAFKKEILDAKGTFRNNQADIDTIIKVASIIQREASPDDMNIVSGIIWNRINQGMTLDMDATLQYIKGDENIWWPQVTPADKNIDSPYNTYKNKGLPPSAISNPGKEAIDAALHPAPTDALFYVHDKHGRIHTAETYEQHKINVERYY